ncbi:MAG: pilus assembly protein [Peptococcaceae bacterium]|nr:pilus assembly protein [Peptococcaceae bacterium]
MRKGLGNILREKKGSIFLELTMSISMLMVIFLAIITFAFLFADYYAVHKVAREGAKEASISKDIVFAERRAEEFALLWGLDIAETEIKFVTRNRAVTCYVTYLSNPLYRNFPSLLGSNYLTVIRFKSDATYVWFDG